MRFAILGSGAVGGYFGAKLARSGQQVTFIARGAHLEAIAGIDRIPAIREVRPDIVFGHDPCRGGQRSPDVLPGLCLPAARHRALVHLIGN